MENYTDLIKEEIKLDSVSSCCSHSAFIAILILSSSFMKKNNEFIIEINSNNMAVFRKLMPVVSNSGFKRGEIQCIYNAKGKIKKIRTDIQTLNNSDITDIFFDESKGFKHLENKCCVKNFLKAAFLVSGSSVNPEKGYQIEINFKNHEKTLDYTGNILDSKFNLNIKKIKRKENFFLYIKKFENVVRFLNILEVNRSIMLLQEKSMLREIKIGVNRKLNCELNNMDKVIACGSKQMREFINIKNSELWEKLDNISQNILDERINSPDLSYAEIGEKLGMTKDQISYYIKKISRKYLKYRNNLVESNL
ncbi:MAG: DNA-binding protein WhiA [Candidatus Muiribacteriota bacterium]